MSQDQQTYKRATTAAAVGTITQGVLGVGVALLGVYAQSRAIGAAAWYIFGGLAIWVSLWVLFRQHQLERAEALEAEQLARADAQAAALFDEAGQQLALARKRLDSLYKWGLNVVGVVLSVYLLAAGGALFYANDALWNSGALASGAINAEARGNAALLILLFAVGAFAAFLIARFVAGMTTQAHWRPLRAGAGYLMGNALALALLGAGSVAAYFGDQRVFAVLALVIPAFMVLLGLEVFFAFLLGVYRPRQREERVRPAYDSRIMGWLTRPESIGKIFADTLNYQFGFDISTSWFYRLVARASVPLIAIGAVLLLAMSCAVIVKPQQRAIFTVFGRLESRVASPGLTFKWPWPIGRARKIDVNRVHQIHLGSDTGGAQIADAPMLWTNRHAHGQEQYLVTAPTRTGGGATPRSAQAVAGELIGASVYVTYSIDDVKQYARGARDPERLLHDIASQQINRYFSTRQVDTLLAGGRVRAGRDLFHLIHGAVARARLGLNVLYVSLATVHPPQASEVADKFHEQIEAVQEKQTEIAKAKKQAVSILAKVAGSRDKALEISDAISQLAKMRSGTTGAGTPKGLLEKEADIESLMNDAGGQAAQAILQARAYRWQRAIGELARTERFGSELKAYRQAPGYYRTRLYLDTLADAIGGRRKIILDTAPKAVPTVRLELKPPSTSIESMLGTQ